MLLTERGVWQIGTNEYYICFIYPVRFISQNKINMSWGVAKVSVAVCHSGVVMGHPVFFYFKFAKSHERKYEVTKAVWQYVTYVITESLSQRFRDFASSFVRFRFLRTSFGPSLFRRSGWIFDPYTLTLLLIRVLQKYFDFLGWISLVIL